MATYEVSLEQLGPALAVYLERVVLLAYVSLRAEVVTQADLKLEEISPVGNPAKDPHPGKYRASHVLSTGSPQPVVLPDLPSYPLGGEPAVEAILAEADPGATLFIANAAATAKYADKGGYAKILEGGRRQVTRLKSGKTMWIGSTQADGIYGPTVRDLRERKAEIEAAGVARLRERMAA